MLPYKQTDCVGGITDDDVGEGEKVGAGKGWDMRDFLCREAGDGSRSELSSLGPRLSEGKQLGTRRGLSGMSDGVHYPGRVHLGAPSAVNVQRRPRLGRDDEARDYDDRYEHSLSHNLVDESDVDGDADVGLEHYLGYHRGSERDLHLTDRRITSVALENGRRTQGSRQMIAMGQAAVKLPHCSDRVKVHPLPKNPELGQSMDERIGYRNHLNRGRLSSMEVYQNREGRVIYRNFADAASSDGLHRKLPSCSHHHEVLRRCSTGHLRNEFGSCCGGGEPLAFISQGNQRRIADSRVDSDISETNEHIHRQNDRGKFRDEYTDNFLLKRQKLPSKFNGQFAERLPRMVPPQDDMNCLHHQLIDHLKDASNSTILYPAMDFNERVIDDIQWNHASFQEQAAAEQGRQYLGCECTHSHTIHGTRLRPDPCFVNLQQKHDCHISHVSPEYNCGEVAEPLNLRDSYPCQVMLEDQEKMHRAAARDEIMEEEEEHGICELPNKIHKRKYGVSRDFAEYSHRGPITANWNTLAYDDLGNSEDLIDGGDMAGLYSSSAVTSRLEYQQISRLAHNKEKYHQQGAEHLVRFSGKGRRSLKAFDKFGPSKPFNVRHFNQKKALHKNQNIKKGYSYSHENPMRNNEEVSDNVAISVQSEASEESGEFETLVQEFFLKLSKNINLNPWVQRHYKAQGKLGTLFCIVCGKSSSKEFQDTQGLAKHCIMSRRVGLKAQHWGLHKAICVLLGWSSVMTSDPLNWFPTVLPEEEALAEKEDLILWPPIVVIHGLSVMVKDPEERKAIHVDRIESFLRGKGFAPGKITVCLGKPADQSFILVKFLGTFSGLENASRIHEYFTDNKRGKLDLLKMASCSDNGSSSDREASQATQGDEIDEATLYGYMGVAEDLGRLDFGSKKSVCIKSRREIHDLANAPVKADRK